MSRRIREHKLFEIYQEARGKRIFTKNILPGRTHFMERTMRDGGKEYREFDPTRSKLAAMIMKGSTNVGIRKNDKILYLGASHGYTCSFVSDMVGEKGIIFGIDPAPRVIRDLIFLAEKRQNIVPMLENANRPQDYHDKVCEVDVVFQDVAQKNQEEIFIKNCKAFLKNGGYGLLSIKARSIDIKRKPKDIFIEIRNKLDRVFKVIDYKLLDPFEADHAMIIIKNQ